MALSDKYQSVLNKAQEVGIQNLNSQEQDGKLAISGQAETTYDANRVWNALKQQSGWENEVQLDLPVSRDDIYGYYTVQSGDNLSKIAKNVADANVTYDQIFEANSDQLTDPNKIKPGQRLIIPKFA
jgi:nucleoid-associated protein YgaU